MRNKIATINTSTNCVIFKFFDWSPLFQQGFSDISLISFETSGCKKSWTPPQTCFAYTDNKLNFVNNDCEQNPAYDRHRIVCRKEGNRFTDV